MITLQNKKVMSKQTVAVLDFGSQYTQLIARRIREQNVYSKILPHTTSAKEIKEYNGKPHILELALIADFAFVKAWKGDMAGNLIYKGTARNFNPLMAMAGKITVAEVEELVPAGELDPNQIHTPGIFVQRILQGDKYEKRIEQRTVRTKE